jgi:hypothetical protein
MPSGEDASALNALVRTSWQIYAKFERQPFLVKPSIPILFFGDSDRYFSSRLRVITLGLNPSRVEFPEPDRFLRFESARGVYPRILEGTCYDQYLRALKGYFQTPPNHPYEPWFNSFEPLLRGLDCSYYGAVTNTAVHTDICSPLATDPTWCNLPDEAQHRLFECGTPLWHSLVEWLSPDLIIASLARAHLRRVSFPRLADWRVVYTVERNNPYVLEVAKVRVRHGSSTSLAFGKAANTPFGTVSNVDKGKIGRALKSHIYG